MAGFCEDIAPFVKLANKDQGFMVDDLIRSDGLALLCNSRILEFKKSVIASSSDLRPDWEARKQRQWNDIYCPDPFWRKAIDEGWTIAHATTFVDGRRFWIKAQCGD